MSLNRLNAFLRGRNGFPSIVVVCLFDRLVSSWSDSWHKKKLKLDFPCNFILVYGSSDAHFGRFQHNYQELLKLNNIMWNLSSFSEKNTSWNRTKLCHSARNQKDFCFVKLVCIIYPSTGKFVEMGDKIIKVVSFEAFQIRQLFFPFLLESLNEISFCVYFLFCFCGWVSPSSSQSFFKSYVEIIVLGNVSLFWVEPGQ